MDSFGIYESQGNERESPAEYSLELVPLEIYVLIFNSAKEVTFSSSEEYKIFSCD